MTTMSSNCPLWISIDKNNYNPNGDTPVISRGINERLKMPHYDKSTDVAKGLRGLPSAVVEQIFLLAAHESAYTRWNLVQVCSSWRKLAIELSELWTQLHISQHNMAYDRAVFAHNSSHLRYWKNLVHVCLASPTSVQLYELVGMAATTQWESLHIILQFPDIDVETVETIFTGASFPNLATLRIEEKNVVDDFGQDPYSTLYDSIVFTAMKLQNVYINSDLKGIAPQYGLFGQRIKSIGGSTTFVGSALPGTAGADITQLSLHRWEFDVIQGLTIPSLRYLYVEHCRHDNTNQGRPTIILPSLREIRLTTHSLPVLSQICAGGLEILIIEQNKFDLWETRVDGCLPLSSYEADLYLSTFDLDVWSATSLEEARIYTPISAQHLLTFLHNSKGLKDLTLAVPNDREWCATFVGAMGARWGYSNHLAHCPDLESLTLLMDWNYTEGEWLEDIRALSDARQGTKLKSILCKWTGDARVPESGPAGIFDTYGGEYYGGAAEPEEGGPNLPSDSKQLEAYGRDDEDMKNEQDSSDSSDSSEEDEEDEEELDEDDDDDIMDTYDDIPFP